MCTTMSLTNELHIKIGDAAQLTMKERHIGKFHVWSSCLAPWTSAAVMPLHRGEHLSLERNERLVIYNDTARSTVIKRPSYESCRLA